MLIRAISKQTPLKPSVKELIDHSLGPLFELYESEDNKFVFCVSLRVSHFLQSYAFMMRKYRPTQLTSTLSSG